MTFELIFINMCSESETWNMWYIRFHIVFLGWHVNVASQVVIFSYWKLSLFQLFGLVCLSIAATQFSDTNSFVIFFSSPSLDKKLRMQRPNWHFHSSLFFSFLLNFESSTFLTAFFKITELLSLLSMFCSWND